MLVYLKSICFVTLVSISSVFGSTDERNPFNGFVDSLQEDEDSHSARFWARSKPEIHARGPGDDAQSSLTLDPSLVQSAYASEGLNATYDGSLTPSLTSANNFINWCLTQNVTTTNGKQIAEGSCCVTPMGRLIAKDRMPSCKFQYPKNGSLLSANTTFVVKIAVENLQTGLYSHPDTTFYSAPQTVNEDGVLRGHLHVIFEKIPSYTSEVPLHSRYFTYFKSLKRPAVNGVVSGEITDGLPAGIYRLTSLTTAINHQPALVSMAQHGSIEDAVYFKISDSDF